MCIIIPILSMSACHKSPRPPDDLRLRRIAKLALKQGGLDTTQNYIRNVALKYDSSENPFLLIFLQNRFLWLASIVRANLNSKFEVVSVQANYQYFPPNTSNSILTCPTQNFFLLASPMPKIGNGNVYDAFTIVMPSILQNGYRIIQLFESADTVANFSFYLSCPTLKGVFSSASHDEVGQSFILFDGSFDYTYFINNQSKLDYQNTKIIFNTCFAFDNTVPGLCQSITGLPNPPNLYTSGVTPLTLWGAASAYACFLENILSISPPILPLLTVLNLCAKENDPFAQNSTSPLYLISDARNVGSGDQSPYPITINTNKRVIQITSNTGYVATNFASDEFVQQVVMQGNRRAVCPLDPILTTPGLKGSEFAFIADETGTECTTFQITPASTGGSGDFPKGYAVYGLFPDEPCQANTFAG